MHWKTAAVVLLAGVAAAARLDNNYLPPSGAAGAGGYGGRGGIAAPFGGAGGFGSRGGAPGAGGYGGAGRGGYGGSAGRPGGAGGYGGSAGRPGGAGGYGGVGGAGGYGGAGGAGGYGGAGAPSGPVIPIISFENNPNYGDGSYSWSYVTGNDIKAQEEGYQNANAPEGPGTAAKGSYSYVAPDGQTISVYYTADENGFVPQGDHLPTPPPIPQEILEALQKNAADEAAGIYDDGSYKGEGAGGPKGGYGGGAGGYGGPASGAGGYGGPAGGAGGRGGYGGATGGYGGRGGSTPYGAGTGFGGAGRGGYQQGGAAGYSYPVPGK